ncbi:MAG TPA: MHYT domain-containing protein [Thermopolyspora sp.]
MHHVNHFSHGLIIPILAYLISVIGSLLGLLFTVHARNAHGQARVHWLLGAALSIGGTGIWGMHFTGLMGFSVTGTEIRFNVPLTVFSAVVAISVVGTGALIVSRGDDRLDRLLIGGLLTGCGVAGMHYLGIAAMNMAVGLSFNLFLVALSIIIAIVASTVALWFTLRVNGLLPTVGAALVMGVAVTGMHYTGMASLSVSGATEVPLPGGAQPIDVLVPLLVGISLTTMGLLMVVMLSPSEAEMRSEAEMLARIEERRARLVDLPDPLSPNGQPNGHRAAHGRYPHPPDDHASGVQPTLFDPRSR